MNGLMVACTGRLGSDPETRFTSTGKRQLIFSVAVDANTVTTEDRAAADPLWLRVTAWEETAEAVAEVLQRGSQVYVEGKLKHDRWQSPGGEPRCGLSVSAWKVEVHGGIGKRPALPGRSAAVAIERAG